MWDISLRRSQSPSCPPSPSLTPPDGLLTLNPAGRCCPAATPPTRAPDARRSTKSRFRVTCPLCPSLPRASWGARKKGAASLRNRGLDSNRLPPRDAGHCGIPALPRPPVVWPAAAQSPGRWARAAPDTGSVACSFTHHGDRGHHGGDGGSDRNWYPSPGCSCQDAPAVR